MGRVWTAAAIAIAASAGAWLSPPRALAAGAACGSYEPGVGGVIQTFCDGPGTATITVNGAKTALRGGKCSATGQGFAFNLGVVAGPAVSPKPDYLGLLTPAKAGPFQRAVLTLRLGGKSYLLAKNTGEVSPKGGSFTATALTRETVKGAFTC